MNLSPDIGTDDGKSTCASRNKTGLDEQKCENRGANFSEKAGMSFENHAEISVITKHKDMRNKKKDELYISMHEPRSDIGKAVASLGMRRKRESSLCESPPSTEENVSFSACFFHDN